ncbi:MAG: LytTR family DNA-binding domain-containing protein [Bacteroidota bacterium]
MSDVPTLRTLLVDDEEDARFMVRTYLEKFCPQVDVIGEAHSVETALRAIQQDEPDLVLMDVRLSPGSGFDVLEQLPEVNFATIFITAHDEYAMRAIRFSALDYLLKPVDVEELAAAIEKARPREEADLRMDIFRENLRHPSDHFDRIVLPTMEGFIVQEVKDILRCEADRNYTHVILINGKKMVIPRTLKTYDELLSRLGFFRTHQSHLVNLKQVAEYKRRKKGGIAILKDRTEIPVSDSRKDGFIESFLS